MKMVLKAICKNGTHWITVDSRSVDEFKRLALTSENVLEIRSFFIGCIPFDELPDDVQAEVLDTLKVFSDTNVTYECGHFDVSPHTMICSEYAFDFFVAGKYSAKDLYTPEQRRANYIEAFGHAPVSNY